jgi:hypothetical protein
MSRKKSKKLNIVFIILMLAVLGYLYFKFSPSPSNDNKDDNTTITDTKNFSTNLEIKKKSLNLKPTWYKEITAEYPTGDLAGVAEVEKFVRTEIDQLWCANDEEKLTEIKAKAKGGVEMYKCSLDIKYSYSHNNKLLSHKLGEYGTYGGTHGIYSAETFTYDTNGNKLALADIVTSKDTYKETFSEKLKTSFKQIQKQNADYNFDSILADITDESQIDSLPFIVTPAGIKFLFSEINGLAYGAGEVEVLVPFTDLGGVIKSEFLD